MCNNVFDEKVHPERILLKVKMHVIEFQGNK